ncbi:MAG: hypothetical protein IJ723_06515, partial [Ruminococcus sp.]|nr:hypothetical protein [Ruminococcus sp.]
MPLYKAFVKIFLRRLPSVIAYFIVFAVIAFVMGANGEQTTGFESVKLRVAVFDLDETDSSRALIKYISDNHRLVGDVKNSDYAIQDALYYEMIDYAITIDEGFEDKLEAGEFDGLLTTMKAEGKYNTQLLDGQLGQYFKIVSARMSAGDSAAMACIKANALTREHVDVTVSGAD